MITPRTQNQVLPIIMKMTTPSPIQEKEDINVIYDEINQIVYDSRTVATKSMKSSNTKIGSHNKVDKKNETDDSKWVK